MWTKTWRRLGWKVCVVGATLLGGATLVNAAGPEGKVAAISSANGNTEFKAIIDTMIDDAQSDGVVTTEERQLITSQAKRHLSGDELAAIEARLTTIRTEPSRIAGAAKGLTAPTFSDTNSANQCNACCDDAGCGGWFDNMYYFAATDGWAGILDDEDGNNFGFRLGFNMGVPLSECRGIGAQFGMSYGVYNFHGRDDEETASIEDQLFFTAGVFKRADLCAPCPDRWSWGVVYDHMITDNTGEDAFELGVGQIRGQIGYALNTVDEVGLMASFRLGHDHGNGSPTVQALDQGSVYWLHKWCWGAETKWSFGIAEDPGEFVFGARSEVPISGSTSLFAGAQFILPSTGGGHVAGGNGFAEEFWNVSVGIVYYPGGNADSKTVAGRKWMPLLPVADNGSFPLEIKPGSL